MYACICIPSWLLCTISQHPKGSSPTVYRSLTPTGTPAAPSPPVRSLAARAVGDPEPLRLWIRCTHTCIDTDIHVYVYVYVYVYEYVYVYVHVYVHVYAYVYADF